MPANSITIIFVPYHVGLRDHRVGNGPHLIRSLGLIHSLESIGIKVDFTEIEPVDDFEGEIGRSFEIMRRISLAVRAAVARNSFPLVLAGNCMSSAAVACGLGVKDLAFIYFDAHDDLDSPDVNENGYLDAMGFSMLRGESWKSLMKTVPGFSGPFDHSSDVQRRRVVDADMHSVWGDPEKKVDFVAELRANLDQRSYSPALVHLDLDVLDESYAKVNSYPSPEGMFESELLDCMDLVPKKYTPKSLTVCSFDPDAGDGDKIGRLAVQTISVFAQGLLATGVLDKSQQ